jgi:hypothetical protein
MKKEQQRNANASGNATGNDQNLDDLTKQADAEKKIKKPGSQSNHSKQHNNGRGGGK